jgi:hypothetical protein
MRKVGFEPVIPANEQPQTHTLDHAATGIGETNSCVDTIQISLMLNTAEHTVTTVL